MKPTKQHLLKAHELVKEDARLARYEWEEALENSKEAQRTEAQARDKYLALTATLQLLDGATQGQQADTGAEGTEHP